ncbi:DEAD/DEAH box helicase [Stenotrophomonas indicatrix]|uniref:DEAD/DEAH box helicase n=1 Tax=Stenotrophomonas indicatrix TaxID=2045451 RepID=UPI00215ACEF4|nr:DEAD/DEAH box helicase [Stenotrophomonas indicatrix]
MSLPYDDEDLVRWFDEGTLGRSEQCIGGVRNLQRHGDLLIADVQGSSRRPYSVEIDLAASTRTPRSRLQGDCSCPVGRNCKHVAATLVVYLLDGADEDDTEMPQDDADEEDIATAFNGPPRPELLAELSRWQNRRSQPVKPRRNGVIFDLSTSSHRPYVVMRKVEYRPNGNINIGKWVEITAEMLLNPPGYLTPSDISVIAQLWAERHATTAGPRIDINATLQLIIDSGHGWVSGHRHERVPARRGPARRGTLGWRIEEVGDTPLSTPSLQVEGNAEGLVMGSAAGYLDPITGEVGPLLLDVKTEDAEFFLTLPHLLPSEAPVVAQMLQQMDPALPRPSTPDGLPTLQITAMTPVLRLHSFEFRPAWLNRRDPSHWADFATVAFEYDEHVRFLDNPSVFVHDANGDLALLPRDPAEEARRERELRSFHLHRDTAPRAILHDAGPQFLLRSYNWTRLLLQDVPQLEALGWKVEVDDDFRHRITLVEDIDLDIQPSTAEDGWFDLGLDIEVDGRTVPLAPLLHTVLQKDPRWLRGQIDAIDDDENVMLSASKNSHLAIKAARLKPVIALLADLFTQRGAPLRVSARDRGRLRALQDDARLQFKGHQGTRALVQRLIQSPAPAEVDPPAGLIASLRPYQRDGLAWLQYLRQQELGGVLADDMGLGKTLQTLSHILLEKEQGRLQQPALVVVPTSLLHNWQSEAARFTPGLRVLVLHGAERAASFDRIGEHDLVLTTYPLVWRDEAALLAYDYHLLILDEAQQVKNAKSKAAIALRTLHAHHRLCLTGTPLENHLGELWAQFDFLLPGLLGSEKQFNQHWRQPIERGSDPQRAHLLAQRLRPFMLRRRKEQVASELPAKTEITRTVALEGAQRDLYETVRASMEAKVREAVTSQGLGRSHIVVLDALLKLRQVCCDPRLLPGETGKRSAPSAKLELLREMLPEMVEEGRRILLFSQFTSMLALIAQALDEMGLGHVQLTGDTQDRVTPVQRFMQGEVPIFLISLKAGGVGLNLTAADTVIHFDPWWNPAAERQATDRAHRIGQEQPVFVYRLIAAGGIEERIAELQQRKAALAETILEGTGASGPRFSDEDLEALLAPLPGAAPKGRRGRAARG